MRKIIDEIKRIWTNFTPAGQRTFGVILLCFLVLGTYAVYKNSRENDNNPKPTIEELHPDIGEALPPDVQAPPEKSGVKVGATVPDDKGTVAGESTNDKVATNYLAPTTGSDSLPFTVSSYEAGNETLATLNAQLKLSLDVSEITETNFDSNLALQFKTKQSGDGLVFISNNKIFYLYGNSKDFSKFQLPR